jgi:AmmeMemoRadiSam system protein A
MASLPKSPPGSPTNEAEFSLDERRFLLRLARDAITAAIQQQPFRPAAPTLHLGELRAVFTTLYRGEELRGCVGHVAALEPLVAAVAQTAASAALHDPRFPPVTLNELPAISIELSVLSPLRPILPEQVEVGRHGLLVVRGSQRGLLLPEVPLEFGWGREMFLAQTCRKAGLPMDAWRAGAELLAFTTEKFGDGG